MISLIRRIKKNKSLYYSLVVLISIILITTPAEFIANNKPIFIHYEGKNYFPIFKHYTIKDFGQKGNLLMSYNEKDIISNIQKNGFIIWAPIRYSYDSIDYNIKENFPTKPSFKHILGTDDMGRDILAIIIYSVRTSLVFGFIITLFTTIIGIIYGALQGYLGGRVDMIMQKVYEIWSSLPTLYILIILSSLIDGSFITLVFLSIVFRWTMLVTITRAEFLKLRNIDFVINARTIGMSNIRLIFTYILPNALTSSLTLVPFVFSGSIAMLTSLDFLGIGLPFGAPSLGVLVATAQDNLFAPWIALSAFFSISALLTIFIFIGEGIREIFTIYGEKNE